MGLKIGPDRGKEKFSRLDWEPKVGSASAQQPTYRWLCKLGDSLIPARPTSSKGCAVSLNSGVRDFLDRSGEGLRRQRSLIRSKSLVT
jgi:hypothetical protein